MVQHLKCALFAISVFYLLYQCYSFAYHTRNLWKMSLLNKVTVCINFRYKLELKELTFSKMRQATHCLGLTSILSRCKQTSCRGLGPTFS